MVSKILVAQKCVLIWFPQNMVHFVAVEWQSTYCGRASSGRAERGNFKFCSAGVCREHTSTETWDVLLRGTSCAPQSLLRPAALPFNAGSVPCCPASSPGGAPELCQPCRRSGREGWHSWVGHSRASAAAGFGLDLRVGQSLLPWGWLGLWASLTVGF